MIKEKIIECYYNEYINNFLKIYKSKDIEITYKWLNLFDIMVNNYYYIEDRWNRFSNILDKEHYNPFINKFQNNPDDLGLEIYKKGYYTPFVVYQINENYILYEGFHRYNSIMNNIIKENIPKDYKILCSIIPKEVIGIIQALNSNLILSTNIDIKKSNTDLNILVPNKLLFNDNNEEFIKLNIMSDYEAYNIQSKYFGFLLKYLNIYPNIKPNIWINNEKELEKKILCI